MVSSSLYHLKPAENNLKLLLSKVDYLDAFNTYTQAIILPMLLVHLDISRLCFDVRDFFFCLSGFGSYDYDSRIHRHIYLFYCL